MGLRAKLRDEATTVATKFVRNAARRVLASTGYEGATTGRRAGTRRASDGAANDVIAPSLDALRNRSRDLCRNHWAAKRARNVLAAKIVGQGITPSCRDSPEFEDLLRVWSRPQTQVGAEKGQSLPGLQRLAVNTVIESGSAILLRRWKSRREMQRRGLVMPFDVMVLEPEYLDSSRDGVVTVNGQKHLIVHGIEFGPDGWPVAYWLHTEHPGASRYRLTPNQSIRVDAADVSHVFWRERSGQALGVPWFAAVLLKLQDFDKYEDAELVRAQVASMFVAFIRNEHGEPDVDEDPLSLESGRLQYLDMGETVEFSKPPDAGGFADFSTITIRSIAAGLGLSYEDLSNDYSLVNFSSARMGAMVTNILNDQWQGEMVVGMMCCDLERWAREGAEMMGIATADATWTAPGRELIDPAREVAATGQKIELGLTSRDAEIRKSGRDPEEVDQERQQSAARAASLGLSAAAESPSDEARNITEMIQKIYLGVGKVLTEQEARDILNRAGAGLKGKFSAAASVR